MLGEALAVLSPPRHPRCGRPDLVLGFEIDPLRLQCAMVDTRIDIEFGEARARRQRAAELTGSVRATTGGNV